MGVLQALLAAAGFISVTNTYGTNGTYTETVPLGATTAVIEVWGSSGAGGAGFGAGCTAEPGGGASSGSYAKTSFSVAGQSGHTWTLVVGAAGGAPASTVTAGTVTGFTTMSAPAGIIGGAGSSGTPGTVGPQPAIATGGTVTNSRGTVGGPGAVGGAGVVGTNGTGNAGGHGGANAGGLGRTFGGDGLVVVKYT